MQLRQLSIAILFVVSVPALAQNRSFELGVKGGGTFTGGFTRVPAQTIGTVQIPSFDNKNNGVGIGYSGGIWARKNFKRLFIQADVTYNRFALKQKTNVMLDVNASSTLANALPISVQPGLLTATLTTTSETILEAVDVPILIGKRWMGGKLRGYAGPNFLFMRKAQLDRVVSGFINANDAVSFPQTDIPASSGSTNLLNKYEAQNIEVKDFTYGLTVGAGFTPLPFVDIDVRLSGPIGGVYTDSTITGLLGFATVSVGFRLF